MEIGDRVYEYECEDAEVAQLWFNAITSHFQH